MFVESDSLRILLYSKPVDMRRAIDGLATIVSDQLDESPTSGNLYVFYNRSGDKLKIIYWQRSGFCLFYKRLEKSRFKLPSPGCQNIPLTMQQLRWLLDGLDFTRLQGHKPLTYQDFY
jgi:transposase